MKKYGFFLVCNLKGNHLLLILLMISTFLLSSTSHAETIWSSSWNAATGKSQSAITDGGAWHYDPGLIRANYEPEVFTGGPGGNNYLRMRAMGGGYGSPYWYNLFGNSSTGDPDDLYIRMYIRVNSGWSDGGNTHWWMTETNPQSGSGGQMMIAQLTRGETAECGSADDGTDFQVWVQGYGSTLANAVCCVPLYFDTWYRYEIHAHAVSSGYETWTIRIDGVDVTSDHIIVEGSYYGQTLTQAYSNGGYWTNDSHNYTYIATYDQDGTNQGWDVSSIEVRDDTWPGPVDGSGGGAGTPPISPKNLAIVNQRP